MKKTILPLSVLASLAFVGAADAGTPIVSDPKAVIVEEPTDWCESIWSLPTLYKNDQNAFIQEFKLIGRYQLQYANVDSNQGGYSDWESRRFRVGAQAKLFNFMKVLGQINIDPDFDPFYSSIDEAYVEFDLGSDYALIVGKHKPKFTYEYSTSSKQIVTFERSLLVNQITPDKSSGATLEGNAGNFHFSAGLFSGDGDAEFGGFDESVFSLLTVGSDLGFADWTLGYLYNGGESNNNTAPYRHSFSNSLVFGEGPFKVATDLIYANGFDDDAYGLVLLPTYDLTEKLQLVGRYQYAHGDNDSLRAQSRYERRVPDITDGGYGEDYNAFYAGVNYYICDHNLKLMTGIEYSDLNDDANDGGDFDGWTVFTGVRMYF